jgi:hypothetical protein
MVSHDGILKIDIKKDLEGAKNFVKEMFPDEDIRG